jgi:hypothetical protein
VELIHWQSRDCLSVDFSADRSIFALNWSVGEKALA